MALGCLAIAGIAAYHLALIGPFAVILMLNPWVHYYGAWPVVGVLLFIWWTLQPNHVTPGIPVARTEAPALFEAADALADRLGAPRIDEVRLVDDFNAAAVEAPVRWQPWRKRRVLVLGVPLLALADKDTVRSVIAHELGHFSRRHGRLGQWIYRARAGWLEYAEATTGAVSPFERGAAFFAGWFAPRFSRLSFSYSRRCEFEADAYGAAVVGELTMASALLTVEAFGDRWQRMEREQLPRLIAQQDAPPGSWMAEVQGQVLTRPPQSEEWERLQARFSGEHDTHPSVGERVRALGVSGEQVLQAARLPDRPAGVEWMPDWVSVVARHDAGWQRTHAGSWRREHIRQQHQRRHLDALRAAQDLGLGRASLELEYGAPSAVMDLARPWLDHDALGNQAAFLLGAAQLAAGNKSGIATLEACIARDPVWAAPARARIGRHAAMLDGEASRRRNQALFERAVDRRARALSQLHMALARGGLTPARLDDLTRTVLQETLSGMPMIAAAWCAADEITNDNRRYTAVALILRLHTARLNEVGLTEDDVRAEAFKVLDGVLPDVTLKFVWSAYTTEPLTPELDSCLSAWARSEEPCCLVMPKPNDAVAAGVRPLALG